MSAHEAASGHSREREVQEDANERLNDFDVEEGSVPVSPVPQPLSTLTLPLQSVDHTVGDCVTPSLSHIPLSVAADLVSENQQNQFDDEDDATQNDLSAPEDNHLDTEAHHSKGPEQNQLDRNEDTALNDLSAPEDEFRANTPFSVVSSIAASGSNGVHSLSNEPPLRPTHLEQGGGVSKIANEQNRFDDSPQNNLSASEEDSGATAAHCLSQASGARASSSSMPGQLLPRHPVPVGANVHEVEENGLTFPAAPMSAPVGAAIGSLPSQPLRATLLNPPSSSMPCSGVAAEVKVYTCTYVVCVCINHIALYFLVRSVFSVSGVCCVESKAAWMCLSIIVMHTTFLAHTVHVNTCNFSFLFHHVGTQGFLFHVLVHKGFFIPPCLAHKDPLLSSTQNLFTPRTKSPPPRAPSPPTTIVIDVC